MSRARIVVLGIFVADATFRAARQPRLGETVLGTGFSLGPGGKGSNQAVAAACAGGEAHILTRIGRDAFGEMAERLWAEAGVTSAAIIDEEAPTGAASIYVDPATGDNAIIVCPGASGRLSPADLDAHRSLIDGAAIFMTQLEQPVETAVHGLRIARECGVRTILNPAPAADLSPEVLALCDLVTPNESEAEALTGVPIADLADAVRAAGILLDAGAGAAVITLGERGALYRDAEREVHVLPPRVGPAVETTGAGDTFNGALAAVLARGADVVEAVRFGCAAASISVTRPGAAASAPHRADIEALLAQM